jgi:hypothetical protein
MEYSQYNAFMQKNDMYEIIEKMQSDIIFNKISGKNKSISFEDFLIILLEMSKLTFAWEKNYIKSFNYFINKYIIHLPCLDKTLEEKNYERWFFFLETPEFIKEVKKHMSYLYKLFNKYKEKDLRIGLTINTNDFLLMCKEKSIIPVFLTNKDVVNVLFSCYLDNQLC